MQLPFAILASGLGSILILGAGAAHSQSTRIVLRIADSFPETGHYFSETAAKHFMETVKRATGGQVEFEHYPAEQMGKAKDLLSLTLSGVVDIGSVMPSYASEKLPLSAVAELPGGFATACQGTLAYWKLARDGVLAQKEYAPNGVRILFTLVSAPYQVLMRQPFDSIKALEGRKLRSTGASTDIAIRKLNAVPIRMAAPEIYDSLSRGTLDGVVVSYAAAVSYNLHTLTKAMTAGENFGSAVLTYSISEALGFEKGVSRSFREARRILPGGHLVLSGILESQQDDVTAAYRPMIALQHFATLDGWVCLAGQRPPAA